MADGVLECVFEFRLGEYIWSFLCWRARGCDREINRRGEVVSVYDFFIVKKFMLFYRVYRCGLEGG